MNAGLLFCDSAMTAVTSDSVVLVNAQYDRHRNRTSTDYLVMLQRRQRTW